MVDSSIIVPILTAIIAAGALIWTAYINRQNKPVRDVLKRTKINGEGSLVEALGVLRKDLAQAAEQRAEDAKYFRQQITDLRQEVEVRDVTIDNLNARIGKQDNEIWHLKRRLREAGINHE